MAFLLAAAWCCRWCRGAGGCAARRDAAPCRRLIHATDELAEGRYVSRVPATGLQELTELGRRFDRMALTRQNAEAELRQSEENLAITLHSIGDAVVATDAQGRITRMNAVAERLTGWPLAQATGPATGRCVPHRQRRHARTASGPGAAGDGQGPGGGAEQPHHLAGAPWGRVPDCRQRRPHSQPPGPDRGRGAGVQRRERVLPRAPQAGGQRGAFSHPHGAVVRLVLGAGRAVSPHACGRPRR